MSGCLRWMENWVIIGVCMGEQPPPICSFNLPLEIYSTNRQKVCTNMYSELQLTSNIAGFMFTKELLLHGADPNAL